MCLRFYSHSSASGLHPITLSFLSGIISFSFYRIIFTSTSILSCRVKLQKDICVCCLQSIKIRFSHSYATKTFITVTTTCMLLYLKVILPLSFYLSFQWHLTIYESLIPEKYFHLVSRTSNSSVLSSFLPDYPFYISFVNFSSLPILN